MNREIRSRGRPGWLILPVAAFLLTGTLIAQPGPPGPQGDPPGRSDRQTPRRAQDERIAPERGEAVRQAVRGGMAERLRSMSPEQRERGRGRLEGMTPEQRQRIGEPMRERALPRRPDGIAPRSRGIAPRWQRPPVGPWGRGMGHCWQGRTGGVAGRGMALRWQGRPYGPRGQALGGPAWQTPGWRQGRGAAAMWGPGPRARGWGW